MPSHCTGRTKSGAPYSAETWHDGFCYWHHPELEAPAGGGTPPRWARVDFDRDEYDRLWTLWDAHEAAGGTA
jgi:hypothetical protein